MSSAQRAINLTEIEQEPPDRTQYDNQFKLQKRGSKLSFLFHQTEQYSFPQKGRVEFKNVYMSYHEDKKPVLCGVSFVIEPGKKVAFVGRTGAGKSSILQALFRMFEIQKQYALSTQYNINHTDFNIMDTDVNQMQLNQKPPQFKSEEYETNELENLEGFIKIDNHSIEQIGIQTLRDGFTIIPQIPFIFTGTIRMNIDPFQKYTDKDIWDVLKEIQLDEKIKAFPQGLETQIQNSSESFTAGQKQLICLARAILKNSRILVLDEITSNCDAYTEDLIIELIKRKFAGSTIITVAHRLHTIADYDKIIVMDRGQIAEQGSPAELLKIPDGIFANMVQSSGDKASKLIRKISRNKPLVLQHLRVPVPQTDLNNELQSN